MIGLPTTVLAHLTGTGSAPVAVERWEMSPYAKDRLREALGRSLASATVADLVASSQLAVATGDEIVYPPSAPEAHALLTGNTVIVQRLERTDRLFRDLVDQLRDQSGRLVSLSAYIADVADCAFSWHVDKWDNVALQLQGTKEFAVRTGPPHRLEAGDALFLPQDVEHRTRVVGRSIHLSVVCFRP